MKRQRLPWWLVVGAVVLAGALTAPHHHHDCSGQADHLTQSCLDQLNKRVQGIETDWCQQHPFDDGCKYSANPDPSQYK